MTWTTDQLLDLDGISQRVSGFRFQLLAPNLTPLGDISPWRNQPPTISNNSNRAIKRTLSGLVISPDEAASVSTVQDRVKVTMELSNGESRGLGVFLFGDTPRPRHSWGSPLEATMVDQCFMIDQPSETTISYPQGTLVADALEEQFDLAGVPIYQVDAITTVLGSPMGWPPGTSRLKVMNNLAAAAGCYSVYFDNDGTGRVRVVPELELSNVDVTYAEGDAASGRIYRDSIVETDDLLEAPNRFIVIDTTNPDQAIVGSYDIPDSAPHSIANRGFAVPRVIEAQGIGTEAQAIDRARAAAAEDASTYEWADFDGPPDPRHDTFSIVSYLGGLWREQQWGMRCEEGATMSHTLRRLYQ